MQRPGKTHRAAMPSDMRDMQLRNFFRSCRQILENEDSDAAFYFEQIEEHMNAGKPLPTGNREIARLLGI